MHHRKNRENQTRSQKKHSKKNNLYIATTRTQNDSSNKSDPMAPFLHTLFFLFLHFTIFLNLCSADIDTITTAKPLSDPQTLVSKDGSFKLGFFTPEANPNSTDRYLGIWFNKVPVFTVVWIANRNTPITDNSGILRISNNGNLILLNGKNQTIWFSSELSKMAVVNATAQLRDSGNLVLLQNDNAIWQSFDHLTHTLLPGMRPTVPATPNKKNVVFRSWRTPSDPSDGIFSVGIGTNGIPQVFTWKNGVNYWRSGPWDGNNFIGVSNAADDTINDGFILDYNSKSGTVDMSFSPQDKSALLNYMIDPQGLIKEQYWDSVKNSWVVGFSEPASECDFYARCGVFGTCNKAGSPICKCLSGFQPKNPVEWKMGNWSSGCVRSTELECVNPQGGGKQDGFLQLSKVKAPDNIQQVFAFSQDNCETKCLKNCSCIAYAYHLDIGCMMWSKELVDIQEFTGGGVDLFLRLAASELEGKAGRKIEIIVSVTVAGTIIVAILACFLWRWITRKGKTVERVDENKYRENDVQLELQKAPLYTFETLRNATNDFQGMNKLGEGGFGQVYKGVLEDGNEIAVKRLSRASEQGLREFVNEVTLISKLQHRNLVKLLGCCIEQDEEMLVLEYMPNKSLDAFLFDPENQKLLSWDKRRNIIDGICRGLLYLHRDSRLKIIHRDLKASNILLDEDLNPKISDFGMARIFGGNQDQANTRRVVGTYGYMCPEYTMGQFSEKSDVYSFGVVLLEIISGRSNTSFNIREHSYTLLGYAWNLWSEGNTASLIDPTISQPSDEAEIIRCIQVALLCVQELPQDRPNISTVKSMLDNDIKHLQHPKKPPFTEWDISPNHQQGMSSSAAHYSISIIEGR